MKKQFLATSLVTMMVLSLAAYDGGKETADTTAALATIEAPANTKTGDKAEDAKAGAEAAGGKAPEGYRGTAVVYPPHDTDPLNAGVNLFMEKYPNVRVGVVAAGIDELCSCVAVEIVNPTADALWGGDADSPAAFREHLEPYVYANDEFIEATHKDPNGLWVDEDPLPMVIFYNRDSIKKDGLIVLETWEDLAEPEWKGKITYCLPSKSGPAYTQLCTTILGRDDKEDGWDSIKKLYDNLDGRTVDSSGKCHEMVTDGEFYVGLTSKKAAVQHKGDPPVGFVYPEDGISVVLDGVALAKGCPNGENTKPSIGLVTSKECQTKQNESWDRRPIRSDMGVGEGMVKLGDILLVDYDSGWAASEKEAIIEHFNDTMVD